MYFIVLGVAKSQTQLSEFFIISSLSEHSYLDYFLP